MRALLVAMFFLVSCQMAAPAASSEASAEGNATASLPTLSLPTRLDAGFGLIVNLGGHGFGVRSEIDDAIFFRAMTRGCLAVSPDRRKIAYWQDAKQESVTLLDDLLPHTLRIFDLTMRTTTTILTLDHEKAGVAGWLAWASDGSGLAVAVHDERSVWEGRGAPIAPRYSSIRLVDVGSGAVREAFRIEEGSWLQPLS